MAKAKVARGMALRDITVEGSKNDPAMLENEWIRGYVARRIAGVFDDLTVILSSELARERGQDMPVGALALAMTDAKYYLLERWARWIDKRIAKELKAEKMLTADTQAKVKGGTVDTS